MVRKKKWYGYVYAIYNSWNDRMYIGASTRPFQRWSEHKNRMRYDEHPNELHMDMRNQRLQGFHFERIDCADNEKALRKKEHKWMKELDTINPVGGYNRTDKCNEINEVARLRSSIANYARRMRLGKKFR